MMADTTADPHLGRVVAGYRIEERIGRGGMGAVYRVTRADGEYRHEAALKRIRTHHPDFVVLNGDIVDTGYPADVDPGEFVDDYRRATRQARSVVERVFYGQEPAE